MARIRDTARVAALRTLSVENESADQAFDRLSRLAARVVGAPAALVNLVEIDRQITRSAFGDPARYRRGDIAPLTDSICKYAVATGETVVITDARGDPRSQATACVAAGAAAYAGAPLTLTSGHTLGSLCVLDDRPRDWTEDELAVLTDLAAAAVTELELLAANRAAADRLAAEANARRLEAVQAITDVALVQVTLDDTLRAILDRVRALLATDTATVLLLDETGRTLHVRASAGLEVEVEQHVTVPVGQGILGRIAELREPLIVGDVAARDAVSAPLRQRVRSLLGAPLLLDGDLVGIIHVGTAVRRAFSEEDVRLLELAAGRVAAAIERARLFDAERAARVAAEAASRAKTEFLAVMSHELRTPLNAIGGYAALLDAEVLGPVPTPQREMLGGIRRGQQRLTQVIDDILQFVDLDREAPPSRADPMAIGELLDAVDTDVAARAAGRGLSYERACPEALPRVAAPRAAVVDILTPIADNALKFTPSGGRLLLACDVRDNVVTVSISDSGPGIPESQLAMIFEPFARADASYRRVQEGAGLGLAITRARRFGGELHAERAPSGGARLTLSSGRVAWPFAYWCSVRARQKTWPGGAHGFASGDAGLRFERAIPFRKVIDTATPPLGCPFRGVWTMAKKHARSKQSARSSSMRTVHPRAAGLDVGSTFHVVAVAPELSGEPVRTFRSFTGDLHRLADWLQAVGITTIAMESTGIYWIPVFEILEARGFEVLLVNARDVKNVPGRKTDVNDAQWLQQLHQFGLLRGSFRPHERVIQLRAILRHRERLIESGATHIQLMQKALMQMNVQLQHAVSDITGLTGMRIIRAVVEGEHDPAVLAQFRDGRCKASVETIQEALTGNYRPEHVFALRHALEIYDFLHGKIAECDAEIATVLEALNTDRVTPTDPLPPVRHQRGKNEPRFDVRRALYTLLGADLSQIHGLGPYTVLRLIAECGDDMSKWPTAKHFTSWLTLAPGNKISGGKVLSSKTRRSSNRATVVLRMVAVNIGKTQTALGAFYRRLAARVGKAKAVTATARKLAVLFYNALRFGLSYVDPGVDYYEARYRERVLQSLRRRAQQMGLALVEATGVPAPGVS